MLNNSELNLNERETERLVNNLCFRLTKLSYRICVDTLFTKKVDFNNHSTAETKVLEPFSSRKSSGKPSFDEFAKT